MAEVPEELSLWQAICAAPPTLRVLQQAEFWGFLRFMIRAVETADKPYAALVAAGLSPYGWDDPEPTTNQLRRVPAFLRAVERVAEDTSLTPNCLEVWQQAWHRERVPGFKSAEDFWRSALGTGLRVRTPMRRVAAVETVDYDAWLLDNLVDGKTLDQLARDPRTLDRFKTPNIPDAYIEELAARIAAHRERGKPHDPDDSIPI
jgi:hypothetical protein